MNLLPSQIKIKGYPFLTSAFQFLEENVQFVLDQGTGTDELLFLNNWILGPGRALAWV
jgi:hypothetical protein